MHTALWLRWLVVLPLAAGPSLLPVYSQQVSSPLSLGVRVDRKTYSLKDTMRVEVQLTNIANEDIYVYEWYLCWGQGPALNLQVFDASGKFVGPGLEFDCLPPPPRLGDLTQFVRIEPSKFYGISDSFKVLELVKKPGEYDLVVQCGAFLPADYWTKEGFPKLAYWTSEHPRLKAKVHISALR